MLPLFNSYLGGSLGSGQQVLSWIHIEDAARAIIHMIDHKTFSGPFNVTAPEPETMKTFAHELGIALKKPALFAVPSWALKLGLGDKSKALLGGQRAIPRRLQEADFEYRYPTLHSALAELVAQQKLEAESKEQGKGGDVLRHRGPHSLS
jgi:uncharacterized protein